MDSVEVVCPSLPRMRRQPGGERPSLAARHGASATALLVFIAIIAIAVLSTSITDALLKAGILIAIWLALSDCFPAAGLTAGPAAGPIVGPIVGPAAAVYGYEHAADLRRGGRREEFGPPGAPAPYPVYAPARRVQPWRGRGADYRSSLTVPRQYPGAVDFDEYDSDPAGGTRDTLAWDGPRAPEGNPFNAGRVGATQAAGPCLDDEANDDEIGGDERMSYQGTARNDPTRPTAGTMNRLRDMSKYFGEEVAEAEERVWWGRHEV